MDRWLSQGPPGTLKLHNVIAVAFRAAKEYRMTISCPLRFHFAAARSGREVTAVPKHKTADQKPHYQDLYYSRSFSD
jgi:hypothetical protein